ncbi:hypothetical protein PRN20_18030 [Devosia sp. ZB163]|uniref:hypothetical protein n=1 Tax=Devosia sp. ZB163 TaxID=3025938 RepID=UPI00235F34D3|nr:hypothetical protein [Devosia sp. ZB163]MDC9825636.1 hypothetical protein [Devosia sp. ZB163]
MTDTRALVERLKPRHIADEPLARAVVSTDQAERRAAVSDFLVANNALKSEAAAALSEADHAIDGLSQTCIDLEARAQAAEAERYRLKEALRPFAEYMGDRGDLDYHGNPLPDEQGVGWVYLTQADFRRAREALSLTPQEVE